MGWPRVSLGDVVDLQRGYDLPERDREAGSVPVMGSFGVTGSHSVARAPAPGVTIGRSGASFGVVNYVSVPYWPHNTVLFATDFKGNHPRYVSYLLRTLDLQSLNSGSAQPSLNRNYVYQVPVHLPPSPVQRQIAGILAPYDDFVENNTKRIKILEEMAGSLYHEWFVNFRFPGHKRTKFINSKLGRIPEGWSIRQLRDYGEIVTGKTPTKTNPANFGDDVLFVKLPDMHGQIFCTETQEKLSRSGADSQESKYLPPDSICVSCIGSAGVVCITTTRCQTNQQINSIIPTSPCVREFLYVAATQLSDTLNRLGSSGATMTNVNKEKFSSIETLWPSNALVEKFHNAAGPCLDSIRNLQLRNANLRATRDLLLPRLISGEIDVSSLPLEPAAS